MIDKEARRHGGKDTRIKFFLLLAPLFPCLLTSFFLCILPVRTQELNAQETNQQATFKTANKFSYNLQKYTGFNLITDFIASTVIKSVVKLKTKARNINVDLRIYSGIDLIKKKAKSLTISANDLFVKGIPLQYFELVTTNPIYFKKVPLYISSLVRVNLDNITDTLNTLPKWQRVFKELELPLPPFGVTKVTLHDFNIKIDNEGHVQVFTKVKSLENPSSESLPLKMKFSANLIVSDKKLVLSELKTNIEDIFTEDSDTSKSFSELLMELINPIVDFHKYERNGLTIDDIKLSYEGEEMVLAIDFRLLPEEESS